ncbi:MAG: tetratricopeptide repeat protein [Campylobacteraceae bacterium]|nr:tetratricopeptide repeat protein [Campylobacteraceae bacterium]
MENFFIDYRDPIFGLIVLMSIAFIIALFSYVWGVFSTKDKESKLEEFITKFNSKGGSKSRETLKTLETETLVLLADIYTKSGDFDSAIETYTIANQSTKNKKEKDLILTNLGVVYYEAGFYKKAENIFLEIIKFNPRNQEALKHLSVIYEKLKMYESELEVLEVLKEQGVTTELSTAYIKAQMIADDASLPFNKKIKEILKTSGELELINRFILELFIRHKEPLSGIKNFPSLKNAIDIVWHLKESVNLKDSEYKAVFFAKGLSDAEAQSSFFEINALSAMRKGGFMDGDLSFKYLCSNCKTTFPYHFYRCPKCYTLDKTEILPKIIRRDDEINMPF